MGLRPTVALAVSGSIAAYKAPMVARALLREGIRVLPVMTHSAAQFLGPETLSGLTGEPVRSSMFGDGARATHAGEEHVDLARQVDAVVIVPATADLLARLSAGRADDLVTALCLTTRAPLVIAPAMHPRMWDHPATQRNVATLRDDARVSWVGPVDGEVASGESGIGRLAEPEAIAAAVIAELRGARDLLGLRVLVSAGPTVEDIDAVRFLSNRSTGKMGFAIARRAAERGASVVLVSGPVQLPTPRGVTRIDVRSALSMQQALDDCLGADLSGADVVIMTAAVGDYRPRERSLEKWKRDDRDLALDLVPNPDLIAGLGDRRKGSKPRLVAFAVETAADQEMVALARGKLEKKRVDWVVANHAADSFGKDSNRAFLVSAGETIALGVLAKSALADRVLDRLREELQEVDHVP